MSCALLTFDSSIVPGANFSINCILSVLQQLRTLCSACVSFVCEQMCHFRPERDTAVA